MIRSYTEMARLATFEERFAYLKLSGEVAHRTFGADRYLNQQFYTSRDWRQMRQRIIARDMGLDLGVEGYEIYDKIVIHHLNVVTVDQLAENDPQVLDPENLITTTLRTHNAIHYGDECSLRVAFRERTPGDTKLW